MDIEEARVALTVFKVTGRGDQENTRRRIIMFGKQLYIAFTVLVGFLFVAQSLQADSGLGRIVSFDDE